MRRVPARALVLTLALLTGATACSSGPDPVGGPTPREDRNAPPDAGSEQEDGPRVDARLEGRVVAHDGRPLGGVTVQVSSEPTAGEKAGGIFAFVFTGGFACILSQGCFPTGRSFQTTTAADGRYSVVLPRAHIPGYEADTDWFAGVIQPPGPGQAKGPSTVEEFEVAAAVQASPDLLVWSPPITVDANRERVVVDWTPLDPSSFDGRRVRFALSFAAENGGPIWAWDPANSGDVLDARVLEDVRGTVVLTARGDATSGPTVYHRSIVAPQVPFSGPAGAPPSRGAGCSATDTENASVSGACWLTDGNLTLPRSAPLSGPRIASASVDLGRSLDAGLLVVRGCGGCTIETSPDGTTWSAAGSGEIRGPAVVNLTGGSLRFVRLSRQGGGVEETAEVSVWPPLPKLEPSPEGRLPDSVRDGTANDDDDMTGMVLLVAAFALVLIAAAAVGWFLSSRRRS